MSARKSSPSLAVPLALGLFMSSQDLAYADERNTCIDASEQGQELRDEGKLLDARRRFLICSREVCPALVRTDCASWLANVEARLPSVVVSAKDESGRDIAEVRVTLDRRPWLPRLDGKAMPLDPGEHVVQYERSGSAPIEEKVIVHEGEQRRILSVRFTAPKPPDAPRGPLAAEHRPVPLALWILGGAAIASGGVFTYFGLRAKLDYDDAKQSCAPACNHDVVEAIRTQEIVANVALGAGVLALSAATIIFLTRPSVPSGPLPVVTVDFRPTYGGGTAVLTGRFSF